MSGIITRAQVRAFSSQALKVVHNVAKRQFLISMRGENAAIDYEDHGQKIVLLHTNVPDIFRGKGVGSILAQYAFDHAAKNKLDVTCKCHFLADYYNRNIDKYKGLKVKIELEDE